MRLFISTVIYFGDRKFLDAPDVGERVHSGAFAALVILSKKRPKIWMIKGKNSCRRA